MEDLEIYIDWKEKNTKNDIFSIFSEKLGFPDYFWNNFDAFWDIMSNKDFEFNWNITIKIINTDFIIDKKIVLNILKDLEKIDGYVIIF